ncbi:bacteriophage spanin2 family protein [Phaeobacter gallaeciensis]|uniref:bacteriophage spanin2 family protein n=1 Tax=Phaeobacter gallaeciensis TaxID=60890 RepID=UPI00237FD130|nr:bacteriophage spanin2 family protein [Phaeobacter gallaeciensis]MDE4059783.1 bacteriophage spanin2 family protein [Phaeobacter gallaeciensis]MDE4122580.1 bacteriophage spanin2 family protein [Phaeobacter gallaeciensis]MDE4127271.1 bacteriophage spanin2 family protein [Phaeobacter gallaeciensis]
MRRFLRGSVGTCACVGLVAILGACSPGQLVKGAASAALGGGPRAAANVQAGRANAQVLGQSQITDQRLGDATQARTIEQSAGETGVRAEAVQSVTVRNEAPVWVWLLLIAGWVLPSPGEIARGIRGLFIKKGSAHADR